MSSTWVQRKNRLRTLLGVSGDDDEEGIALDRLLSDASMKTGKLAEVEKCRISDRDFSLMGTLASGQFGNVELVNCRLDGCVYARKRIAKRLASRTRDQCSPQTERDILIRALRSRTNWVPHILCAYHDQMNLSIVMSYAPGGSLWDVVESSSDDGRLSYGDLVWWIPQCASAIHWCHTQGFVHRDIKPHNFVISDTSHIQLIDFGSAAPLLPATEDGVQLVPKKHCLVPCGTCDYISPEILKAHEDALIEMEMTMHMSDLGENDTDDELQNSHRDRQEGYGREVDWWSFGAMIYELAYGVAPFFADDIRQTYQKIIEHGTSLRFNPSLGIRRELISLIKSFLCHHEDRLGRHSFDDIKDHAFFAGVNWEKLTSSRPHESLLLPQFTYSTPLAQRVPSETSDETQSKPFAFSALFQSSPGLSVLHTTPARKGSTIFISETDQRAVANFIGFSWGPSSNAFNKNTGTPVSSLRRTPNTFLATPGMAAHSAQYFTPARPGIMKDPVTSARRIASAGQTPRPVRLVSDREAFRQLVDCVGMSARKRVLESGRKPRVLVTNQQESRFLSRKVSQSFSIPGTFKKELRFTESVNARWEPPIPDMVFDGNSVSSDDTDVPVSPSPSPRPGSAMSMVSMASLQQRSRSATPTISGSFPSLRPDSSLAPDRSTLLSIGRPATETSASQNTTGSDTALRDLERRHSELLRDIERLRLQMGHVTRRLRSQ